MGIADIKQEINEMGVVGRHRCAQDMGCLWIAGHVEGFGAIMRGHVLPQEIRAAFHEGRTHDVQEFLMIVFTHLFMIPRPHIFLWGRVGCSEASLWTTWDNTAAWRRADMIR